MSSSDKLYAFAFRGLLTEEALDKAGRAYFHSEDGYSVEELSENLALPFIDEEFLIPARQMATVYTAISAFENSARSLVKKVLIEVHQEEWWEKGVSDSIRKKAESRKAEEEKIKWHSQRGDELITFTDFGQLNSIITFNWSHFESLLRRQQWVQHIFETMERSRNVIMHSGHLPIEDIERVGICIRDWMKQTGG
jgi:Swt1-like HEPN